MANHPLIDPGPDHITVFDFNGPEMAFKTFVKRISRASGRPLLAARIQFMCLVRRIPPEQTMNF